MGAQLLIDNDVKIIAEGANMPTTPEAIELFVKNKILFAPAKAANAGGVAVSVLEMSQNSSHNYFAFEKIDKKLQAIMSDIYIHLKKTCDEHNLEMDLISAANILGFKRVADAMIRLGFSPLSLSCNVYINYNKIEKSARLLFMPLFVFFSTLFRISFSSYMKVFQ